MPYARLSGMSGADHYYNTFYRELAVIDSRANSLAKIADMLPLLPKGARVLDIGCGHGAVSAELAANGMAVHGMDIDRTAIAALREHGVVPIEHDISQPFPPQQPYDLVLLLDVLEHVFDPAALLAEAVACLAPAGTIIITVPLYFDLLDRLRILFTGSIVSYDNRCYGRELHCRFRSYNYDHVRFFRPEEMLELCTLAGLQVEKARYVPASGAGYGRVASAIVSIFANRLTARWFPGLFAHGMVLRTTR